MGFHPTVKQIGAATIFETILSIDIRISYKAFFFGFTSQL